ncbi:hypothetical protein EDD71_11370 [Fonticella tunisiensis]|uniref:Uncharacterized protein n=1 Tax=Fonticella tunisiensis TaxID=1096341 RepID=A0A4R7KLE0_9CLOT|nr:hypothetical protein EDD71_11370 [Fonticella tunisiensis]
MSIKLVPWMKIYTEWLEHSEEQSKSTIMILCVIMVDFL